MRRFSCAGGVCLPILLVVVLMGAATGLRGQDLTTSANFTGTVTDSSGAVVPGAQVIVSGVDNGVSRKAETDAVGSFTVPLLPPGNYNLRVESKGFKSYEQKGIGLLPGHTIKQDVQLTIGAATEVVVVTSEAPLLNTGDANLSAEISAQQVEDLPLNLRNVVALATLNSSVSNTTESQQLGQSGTSAYLLDGIWDTDSTWGAVIYVPSVEATGEFKIQTNSFTAQTGFSTGNVINIETKSGT